jgi:carbon-monoxide dehydrogenase small subunit
MAKHLIELTVNDQRHSRTVDSALNLVDFLRNEIGLKGTHIGCEHGVCGACTVLVNQKTVRGCLMLAVQADGQHVQTIESIANADGSMSEIQIKMKEHHGLQCGFCTPGVVMTIKELMADSKGHALSEEQVRAALSGNLCRCTGYQGMVDAALDLINHQASEAVKQ